jgi:hypothetical protein
MFKKKRPYEKGRKTRSVEKSGVQAVARAIGTGRGRAAMRARARQRIIEHPNQHPSNVIVIMVSKSSISYT